MKFSNQHSMYESDHTKFIKELKAQKPHLEEGQREGRALLWDTVPITPDEQRRHADSRIKAYPYAYQAYVYSTKG